MWKLLFLSLLTVGHSYRNFTFQSKRNYTKLFYPEEDHFENETIDHYWTVDHENHFENETIDHWTVEDHRHVLKNETFELRDSSDLDVEVDGEIDIEGPITKTIIILNHGSI